VDWLCGSVDGFSSLELPVCFLVPLTLDVVESCALRSSYFISFLDNDPDPLDYDYPDAQNCILWENNNGSDQLGGLDPNMLTYSCIQNCNEVIGLNNINDDPLFVLHWPDHIHLAYNSPCKDMGNPNLSYDGQVDIDNEQRVYGTYVDMGADEIYSCDDDLSVDDISHPLDKNMDAFINFPDYAVFVEAWLSADPNYPLCDPNNDGYVGNPNDPDYISEADKLRYVGEWDLDSDLFIGMSDLSLFADIWLLMPCWMESQMNRYDLMGMAMGGGQSMIKIII